MTDAALDEALTWASVRAGLLRWLRKPEPVAVTGRLGSWPMWVLGLAVMLDSLDQYIVRGNANQIERAFHVGDFSIGLLFSAFIVVNGFATMPAAYLGDRFNRTSIMAVTITAWSFLSALGGLVPSGAFALLLVLRGTLGFGQAVTDPSGSSLLADYYGIERRGRAFSIQQALSYIGLGTGLSIGSFFGTHFGHIGWRLGFGVSIVPGLVIAFICWRLPEPRRGSADRAHVTHHEGLEVAGQPRTMFPNGVAAFARDMVIGLRDDIRTILRIPTMAYALVGVSTILFAVTAVATWMPTFYQRQFHLSQAASNSAFGALAVMAGIPGTIFGGWLADRLVERLPGARVVIPGVCIAISGSGFLISFIPMPFGAAYTIQLLAFLVAAASVPSLRAGLSDSVPAHLRGAGFGAFNLASILFGSAAAPLATSAVATAFGGNYRVAFSILMPLTIVGAVFLLAARRHIEKDTAKIFEAVVTAMAAEAAQ